MVRFKRILPFSGEELVETIEVTTKAQLQDVLRVANVCKTAYLNDVQITKNGNIVTEIRNHPNEIIAYLNGEVDELHITV